MIWYFLKQYGPDQRSDLFNSDNNHYDDFQETRIFSKNYGADLDLLLIEYHLSTNNNLWDFSYVLEKKSLVRSYSSKEKAISVIIPVVLDEYLALSEHEKKKKFCDDVVHAVQLVRPRLEKKKLDVDFDKLLADLLACNEEYLSQT